MVLVTAPVAEPQRKLGDRGSAPLEFILAGLVLLVPLVYLVITLGLVQGHALGAEAGVRHIARAVATATNPDEARERGAAVLASIAADYGMDAAATDLRVECRPAGSPCPAAGATITVTLRTTVSLPLAPPVLGMDRLMTIPIEASTVQKVSRFWSER